MNYLAHIYLSGEDEDLMIGNFIADSVRGNQLADFPEGVRKGIVLHRKIDSYTDRHPVVTESKNRFKAACAFGTFLFTRALKLLCTCLQ